MSGGDESNALRSAIPREDVIFTDLDGSEGVLVDLNSKKFYQLNESAILIWRGLEKRMSIDMIAQEMTLRPSRCHRSQIPAKANGFLLFI